MNSKYELLTLLPSSSIKEYEANISIPSGIAYELLLKQNYITLCNGIKMKEDDKIEEGDHIMFFLNLENNLEKVI
ncbi:MAG: hypothetical protein PHN56_01090 [Candidatus Nanoarchaeia archaeon]|nr:hypothetical protein [Candidatus Nanoarchaeia archaeon]